MPIVFYVVFCLLSFFGYCSKPGHGEFQGQDCPKCEAELASQAKKGYKYKPPVAGGERRHCTACGQAYDCMLGEATFRCRCGKGDVV